MAWQLPVTRRGAVGDGSSPTADRCPSSTPAQPRTKTSLSLPSLLLGGFPLRPPRFERQRSCTPCVGAGARSSGSMCPFTSATLTAS